MDWSLEVLLSGAGFPRFINTTLRPDSNLH